MRVAIIPARGGSRRIPRKNVKIFGGKPVISWPIAAAIESRCFDKIVVSTDDEEIAEVARMCGAETPFVRPIELADDVTGTTAVVAHAITWLVNAGFKVDKACCIYATAPFLRPDDIRLGLAVLEENDADFSLSVTSYPYPVQRALRITDKNRVEMFDPSMFQVRSQDLEPAYHDAAQFYWGYADAWIAMRPVLSNRAIPVILPRWRTQDIDTPEDWEQAELMQSALTRT